MNENATNNTIILNQDSTAEEYAKILRGRYITGITLTNMDCDGYALAATLTLDNGDVLTLEANEGRGGRKRMVSHHPRLLSRQQDRPHHGRPR